MIDELLSNYVAEDQTEDIFSSYLDIKLSDKNADKIKLFFSKYPEAKNELFHQTKNAMMNTIYRKDYNRSYVKWVIDVLDYFNRHF